MTKISTLQLCSKCIVNEIANWVYENQLKLDQETIKQIREEIKDIKLKEGSCIVCNHNKVSEGCFEKILSILEKNKSNAEAVEDFKKFSGLLPELSVLI